MRTYAKVGDAVADPSSALAQWLSANRPKRARNEETIARLMADGLTREEAWARAFAGMRGAS